MPSGFLQNSVLVGAGATTSLIYFPSSGRASGRIDSILFMVEYTGIFSGGPTWVKNSRIKLYVDEPDTPVDVAAGTSFGRAYYLGYPEMGHLKFHAGAADNWAIALFDLGIFANYFEILAYNDDTSAHNFHATVNFERF